MKKKKFPGSKNNLNALCRRFDISLDSRDKHGALTDSFLLLQVYNELLGGKQQKLELNLKNTVENHKQEFNFEKVNLPLIDLDKSEIDAHSKMTKNIKDKIWQFE